MKDTHARSIVKGVSWRITGTIDTMLVALWRTGQIELAIKIGITEVVTKIILYYLHERVWNVVKWGRKNNKPTHVRSFTKGFSWRIIGTLDTLAVAYFHTGQSKVSAEIALVEVFTKIILYYLHERLWATIKWGRVFDNDK